MRDTPGKGETSDGQQWRFFHGRARVRDWEELRRLAVLNGLSRRAMVALLIAEYVENPRMLRLR